jgi:hypothetical protein
VLDLGPRYNAAQTFIDAHRGVRDDRVAIRCQGASVSYGELAANVDRAGNAFREIGLEPEQRIVILCADSPAFVYSFFGAIKLGAIPVPVNTLLTARDLAYILIDSRARAIVVSAALLPKVLEARTAAPLLRHVIVAGAAPAGGLRVVYGDEVTASGGPTVEDRPTVLCLQGFGNGPLPLAVYLPLVAFSGHRAAIHVASARLFVFAPAASLEASLDAPALVLAGDYGSVRPLEGETSRTGITRFASDVFCEGLATKAGVVPVPNVLPYDAAR